MQTLVTSFLRSSRYFSPQKCHVFKLTPTLKLLTRTATGQAKTAANRPDREP